MLGTKRGLLPSRYCIHTSCFKGYWSRDFSHVTATVRSNTDDRDTSTRRFQDDFDLEHFDLQAMAGHGNVSNFLVKKGSAVLVSSGKASPDLPDGSVQQDPPSTGSNHMSHLSHLPCSMWPFPKALYIVLGEVCKKKDYRHGIA